MVLCTVISKKELGKPDRVKGWDVVFTPSRSSNTGPGTDGDGRHALTTGTKLRIGALTRDALSMSATIPFFAPTLDGCCPRTGIATFAISRNLPHGVTQKLECHIGLRSNSTQRTHICR